jgi:glycosyltransferase involved in cell wall biosynthesis
MGRKILWFGDAGAVTGFGRVTHSIGERLVSDYGHDIHVLAINYRGDHYDTNLKLYRPTTVLPTDIYGLTRMVEMIGRVEPDVVVMLHDPHLILQVLFENRYDPERVLLQYRPILLYLPCDGTNLPPAWPDVLTKVTNVVAMSRWGQRQYPGSKLVYHGVDTDQFWPVKERPIKVTSGEVLKSKRDCKKAFGFDPDGFLVLRVDKNSGRKDFAATWMALVPVMAKYRDIQVHFHCSPRNDSSGVTLPALYTRSILEGVSRDRWFGPDQHDTWSGWPQADLNALYNAADLFVSTSRGEGFGMTLTEAAACGVPVIAQNVSSIPEVVGPGAILIEPQRLITIPSGEDVWLADVEAFSAAIERAYLSAGLRRDLGEAGREHVTKFTWDFAAARFNEYIEALASGTEAVEPDAVAVGVG